MRLFFINMHRLWGGQSAVVLLLAHELAKRGHELLVAGVDGSELVKRAHVAGLPIDCTLKLERGFRARSFIGDLWRLKRLWTEFKPHIVLTNGAQDTWTCGIARKLFRSPAQLVRWRHNSFPVKPHVFNRWLYNKLIDHVTVSSSEITPLLVNTGLLSADRVTVFPPSTPLEACLNATPKSHLRDDLGVGNGTLTLCVGRLAPRRATQCSSVPGAWSWNPCRTPSWPSLATVRRNPRCRPCVRSWVLTGMFISWVSAMMYRDSMPQATWRC